MQRLCSPRFLRNYPTWRSVRRFCEETAGQSKALQATEVIIDLLRYENEERGDEWINRFYQALPIASLKGDIKPQVIRGPDGLMYFRLAAPHYSEQFEAVSFQNQKLVDILIEHGIGAVIFNNPYAAEKEDFKNGSFHSLTYGEILCFHHYKTFLGDPVDMYEMRDRELEPYIAAQKDWHGAIIPPESSFLPKEVRRPLDFYIRTITDELRVPKVAMKVDPTCPAKGLPSRTLTFNYCVNDFERKEEEAEEFLELVRWFLPPTMSVSLLQSEDVLHRVENDEDSPFIPIQEHTEYTPQRPVN